MVRICKLLTVVIQFMAIGKFTAAQFLPVPAYPKGYFQWPLLLKPAIVANFGELRPNHYHMGLDCRTDQKQNQQVLAAADGYIAKVKIEPFGFGRCIYINHPNGYTTLYAHLNDFYPELEKYIKTQQYKLNSWKIFIDIPPGLFPVLKGQFIAFSGSTGGSEGPHLHFEIRDTKTDKVLNPLLFGLPIADDVAPDLLRLAVYDRNISTYEQTPQLYNLKKIRDSFTTSPNLIICNSGKISFGITAFDRNNGSTNRNGIFEALLFDNTLPIIGLQMNNIGYDETRYLNAHIDYKMRSKGGPFIEHLSRLPGYNTGIYTMINGDGVINLTDDSIHSISILVKDANGNTSSLKFDIKRGQAVNKINTVYSPGTLQKEFYPGFLNVFENDKISFYLPEACLYDSFRFIYKEIIPNTGYPVFQLHNNEVPLHLAFPLKIKANIPDSLKNKVVMERSWNNKNDYAKATPETISNETWFTASFRELGNFRLMVDSIPPEIFPIGIKDGLNLSKQNRIEFIIKDNTGDIKNFTAMLDGKWLRFSNDKGRAFIYQFDEMCPPGLHELTVIAEDLVGNKTMKSYHFVR